MLILQSNTKSYLQFLNSGNSENSAVAMMLLTVLIRTCRILDIEPISCAYENTLLSASSSSSKTILLVF